MLYRNEESQTPYQISQLYEATEVIFEHTHVLQDDLLINVVISEASLSDTLVFEFYDNNRNAYSKFTMCQS